MAPQNCLRVDIIRVIVAPAYMISRNKDIIKVLHDRVFYEASSENNFIFSPKSQKSRALFNKAPPFNMATTKFSYKHLSSAAYLSRFNQKRMHFTCLFVKLYPKSRSISRFDSLM